MSIENQLKDILDHLNHILAKETTISPAQKIISTPGRVLFPSLSHKYTEADDSIKHLERVDTPISSSPPSPLLFQKAPDNHAKKSTLESDQEEEFFTMDLDPEQASAAPLIKAQVQNPSNVVRDRTGSHSSQESETKFELEFKPKVIAVLTEIKTNIETKATSTQTRSSGKVVINFSAELEKLKKLIGCIPLEKSTNTADKYFVNNCINVMSKLVAYESELQKMAPPKPRISLSITFHPRPEIFSIPSTESASLPLAESASLPREESSSDLKCRKPCVIS